MKAAEILEKVEQKKGAVKTLVYDSKFQVSPDIYIYMCTSGIYI